VAESSQPSSISTGQECSSSVTKQSKQFWGRKGWAIGLRKIEQCLEVELQRASLIKRLNATYVADRSIAQYPLPPYHHVHVGLVIAG
jgi:hypothetical protein